MYEYFLKFISFESSYFSINNCRGTIIAVSALNVYKWRKNSVPLSVFYDRIFSLYIIQKFEIDMTVFPDKISREFIYKSIFSYRHQSFVRNNYFPRNIFLPCLKNTTDIFDRTLISNIKGLDKDCAILRKLNYN